MVTLLVCSVLAWLTALTSRSPWEPAKASPTDYFCSGPLRAQPRVAFVNDAPGGPVWTVPRTALAPLSCRVWFDGIVARVLFEVAVAHCEAEKMSVRLLVASRGKLSPRQAGGCSLAPLARLRGRFGGPLRGGRQRVVDFPTGGRRQNWLSQNWFCARSPLDCSRLSGFPLVGTGRRLRSGVAGLPRRGARTRRILVGQCDAHDFVLSAPLG